MYEGIERSRGIASLVRNFCSRWRWVFSFTPQPFYPRKRIAVPINRRLNGFQSRSRLLHNKKFSFTYRGPNSKSSSLVTADWAIRLLRVAEEWWKIQCIFNRLDSLAKLRKRLLASSCLSVRVPVCLCISAALTGRILVKICIDDFHENLSTKAKSG